MRCCLARFVGAAISHTLLTVIVNGRRATTAFQKAPTPPLRTKPLQHGTDALANPTLMLGCWLRWSASAIRPDALTPARAGQSYGDRQAQPSPPRKAAYDALRDVIKTLGEVTPHGRDYPGNNDQCVEDRQWHYARLKALDIIAAEIVAEAVAIKNQR